MASRLPLLVFLLLVVGLSTVFLLAPGQGPSGSTPEESPAQPTPLDSLGPMLRGLAAEGGDPEDVRIRAAGLVERVLVEWGAREVVYEPGGPALRQAVVQGLSSEDWGVSWAAALAVPRFGPAREGLARALVQALERASMPQVREAAARGLAFIGEGYEEVALGALLSALADPDPGLRLAALETLARRPAVAVPGHIEPFLVALRDEDARTRRAAAQALAGVSLREQVDESWWNRLSDALAAALGDRSPDVRLYAAMALGRLGEGGVSSVPRLVEALRDELPLVRDHAATALGQMGPSALPALEAALLDPEASRHASVAWALRLAGDPARPILERALAHPTDVVRLHAALALIELREGTAAEVAVLRDLLSRADADVRLLAARGLGRAGKAGREALPALLSLADDIDEGVRAAAEASVRHLERLEPR